MQNKGKDTTATTSLIDAFAIKINGTEIAPETRRLLIGAQIDTDLAQPAMFVLRFHDSDFELIDSTTFTIGDDVTIAASDHSGTVKPIMNGEITALEPVLSQRSQMLLVRGYDRSHRLQRGHRTRTFLKQGDADIVGQIARETGLRAEAEGGSERYDYVIQDNQTDLAFLRERAARIGYQVGVEQKTLRFRRAAQQPEQSATLAWGQTLLEFQLRMTALGQPNEVQVRGWDPAAKRPVVGSASRPAEPSKIGESKGGGAVAQQAFGTAAKLVCTDQPVHTQSEANALAQAVLDQRAGDYLQAEGRCLGEPALTPGTLVEITGLGRRLSGQYFVTAVRHTFTPADGYISTFFVRGQRPTGLTAAMVGGPPRSRIHGVVIGIVTTINDPDALGRIKVKFPWLDEGQESDWARVAAPGAGKARGHYSLPEVDDEVLVAFEQGDMSRPYIIGGLWNGKDTPPAGQVKNGSVQARGITARSGHALVFQEQGGGGDGGIALTTKGGHTITISDTDKGITVASKSHTIHLDDRGRAVTIESGGDIEIAGSGGKLTITAQGIEIAGNGGKLAIAPQGVELVSSTQLTVQGALVKIN
ncbi:MAG TPA: VgrG-related protein [Roseiflexaceae bacterium]|nr:VgrG-related protein [Roseiflexaceae bacterium]